MEYTAKRYRLNPIGSAFGWRKKSNELQKRRWQIIKAKELREYDPDENSSSDIIEDHFI